MGIGPLTSLVRALGLWAMVALLAWAPVPGWSQTHIDLQGHRGARGLLPENTLPAFEKAMALGVTTLELDVVVTRDGEMVISHNPHLSPELARDAQGRYVQGTGPLIRQMDWAQVQTYDVGRINPSTRYAQVFASQQPLDGTRVPRLKDLFARVQALGNTSVRFAIETKLTPDHPEHTPDPEAFARQLLQEITQAGMQGRVQILSFDWRTLQAVQRLSPGTPTVYITAQLPELDNLKTRQGGVSDWTAGIQYRDLGSVPRMVARAGGTHWSSFWRELDADKVREAHSLGLKVLAWTVNDPSTMHRMLDYGVDGLVTDRPDLAIEVLRARGLSW